MVGGGMRSAFRPSAKGLYTTLRGKASRAFLHVASFVSRTWYDAPANPEALITCIFGGQLRGSYLAMSKSQVGAGFAIGSFERHVVRAMGMYVAPGAVVYDVGASYGYHTLLLARLVGADGQVFAFEPNPRDNSLLCLTLQMNGLSLSNVSVFPLAIAAASGTVQFAAFSYPGVSHIARIGTPADASLIAVDAVTLDDFIFLAGHPAPSFMKIDVEGAEAEVFKGAARTLREARPVIVCEVRDGAISSDIAALMASHGYTARALKRFPFYSDVLFLPPSNRH